MTDPCAAYRFYADDAQKARGRLGTTGRDTAGVVERFDTALNRVGRQ